MNPTTRTDYHVRWLIRRDLPEVLAVERDRFEHAWTEDDFLRCLRQRNCVGMAAESRDDRVAGYMIYELHARSIELLNFARHRDYPGAGAALMARFVRKVASHRRTSGACRVRERNLPFQRFLARHGWAAVRVVRNFYADTGEDAYRMVYAMPAAAPGPVRVANRISQYEEGEEGEE